MELLLDSVMSEQKNRSITNTIQQFGKKLFGFVRGKVSSNEDAEDILQDVWYQLSNLDALTEIENLSAWLFQVARNRVTDKYRKKTNLSLEDYRQENEEGEINFKQVLLLDDSGNPELKQFKDIFWKELMSALNELPPNQKEVFVLNEIEDMSLQQIADQKGENIKTIISRKGYAVKHLRNKLNYLYQELNT
ncbi:MAG: sigma-70 family RNA polymerase sigma factor [Bacteroidia bacterium]|nr:sigma-70 family RNA polymerase sigma factor [Bacteroidia bacterium]